MTVYDSRSTTTALADQTMWTAYETPDDVARVESIPLQDRGLPDSTYRVLERAATLWPDRTAISVIPDAARWRDPVELTFGQLHREVSRLAGALAEHGIRRSEPVGLLSPNCAELIVALLACETAGVAAPMNPALGQQHISELLRRSGARTLIAAGPELDETVFAKAEAIARTGMIDMLLLLRPTGGEVTARAPMIDGVHVEYLADHVARVDTAVTVPSPEPDDLAALFHTGGTTGAPKLAAHRHSNEVANAWMLASNTVLDEQARIFAALPLFHVNALIVTVLSPLLRGQTVVWAGPLGYRDLELYGQFWKIVEHHRIAGMSGVPTVYSVLAQCPIDADISSLRVCMVGASMLPRAVRDAFETHTGVPLLEGYGLTEATCASARSFGTGQPAGTVGQRLPYQHIKSVHIDAEGTWTDLPPGEVGTVVIHGPTVFAGYVVGPGPDGVVLDGMGKLVDGWLDTGDLGAVDERGFLRLTGRAKDLIIRGGHNIDPAIIEDTLLEHPDVTGAAAVGRPDGHAGEVPVAYVTLRPGADVAAADLRDWAIAHVPESAAVPVSVTIRDDLPVTDVGKPYKLALRADATRRVVEEIVAETGAGMTVDTRVDDGTVVTVLTPAAGPDSELTSVRTALDRLPLRWEFADRPGEV
ncbi:acyl-CoA synthetase [Gordonia prachuapensis]